MLKFKRGVAAFLLLVILMTMVPVPTFAQEGEFTEPTEAVEPAEPTESAEVTEPAEPTAPVIGEDAVINPLYAGILTEEDLVTAGDFPMLLADDTYTSVEAAATAMAEAMECRQAVITVYLETETAVPNARHVLLNKAMEHTGVPGQGDNLRYQYGGCKMSYSQSVTDGVYYNYVKYTMTYMTTAAQEAQVATATAALRQQLELSSKTDVEKIVAVYNWMCDNITYDYAGLADSGDLLEYSAYKAIVKKTAVCQGYANLFYRLMLEEGIDCRIVSGTSNGEGHAWNIVKIGSYYYNVDATWDANWKCKYFLRGSTNFAADHTAGSEYTDTAFTSAYPIDTNDYAVPMRGGSCGESVTWSVDNTGKLTISGTGAMKDYSANTATPWYRYYSCINAVQVDDGVTYIGDRAFQALNITKAALGKDVATLGEYAFGSCKKLISVSLPAGLTKIERGAFYDCSKLATVIYCGTRAQWDSKTVGSYNTALTGATLKIHNYVNGACTGCGASCGNDGHQWTDATCTVPKTCSVCQLTEGTAPGHSWKDATCTEAKTCTVCGATSGKALGHSWNAATCTEAKFCPVCDTVSGSALGHKYVKGICSRCSQTEPGYIALKILTQPVTVKVTYGETAEVAVEAEGVDLTYTWYYANKGKTKFTKSSTTTAAYTTVMNDSRNGRRVYCVIADKYGNTVKTATVTLKQNPKTPLAVATQPKSVAVEPGEMATVTVEARGDKLTYAWYYAEKGSKTYQKSGDVTGNVYSVIVDDSCAGRKVYCKITDLYGRTVKTKTVTLSNNPLKIITQPTSVTVANGVKAKVTVKAQGDGLTYNWYYRNTGDYAFAYSKTCTGSSYSATMSNARAGRQLYCVIRDKYGNAVVTNLVTLNQKPPTPLTITVQPADAVAAAGETAAVKVTATGDGLTYTWYYANKGKTKFTKSSVTTDTYTAVMNATRDGRRVYCKITDVHGKTVKTETVTLRMP